MSAVVVLHPRSVEWFGLYTMCRRLKDRGYDVNTSLSNRFFVAVPDAPPPVRPPSSATPEVVPFERRARPFPFWWPRT